MARLGVLRLITVLTVGLSLTCAAIVRASTVITVLSDDEIVIAADSRRQASQRGVVTGHVDDLCKIFVVDKFVFGFAGLAGDGTDHFDPRKRVIEILRKKHDSVAAAAAAVADRLFDDYLFAVDRLRRDSRRGYAMQARKETLATVIIAGFDGDRVKGATIEFAPRASEPPVPVFIEAPRFIVSGNRDAIQREMAEISGGTLSLTVAIDQAKRLIKKQATNDPAVGGPIDVVRVTKSGHRWPDIKSGCREQE